MVALSNIGGALCSTPQVWLTPTIRCRAVTLPRVAKPKGRNPLKFAGVPQTTGSIPAASGPKFTILWDRVEDVLLLNKFFSDCRQLP